MSTLTTDAFETVLPVGRSAIARPVRHAAPVEPPPPFPYGLLPAFVQAFVGLRVRRRALTKALGRLQKTSDHPLADVGVQSWVGSSPATTRGLRGERPDWDAPSHWLR